MSYNYNIGSRLVVSVDSAVGNLALEAVFICNVPITTEESGPTKFVCLCQDRLALVDHETLKITATVIDLFELQGM